MGGSDVNSCQREHKSHFIKLKLFIILQKNLIALTLGDITKWEFESKTVRPKNTLLRSLKHRRWPSVHLVSQLPEGQERMNAGQVPIQMTIKHRNIVLVLLLK